MIFEAGHLSFYKDVQASLFEALAAFEANCDMSDNVKGWLLHVATKDMPRMADPRPRMITGNPFEPLPGEQISASGPISALFIASQLVTVMA